jgi:hypothetical protein
VHHPRLMHDDELIKEPQPTHYVISGREQEFLRFKSHIKDSMALGGECEHPG